MDELKENRQKLSQLAEHEAQYVELQTVFHSTEQTEMELQNQLKEWKEYRDGIDEYCVRGIHIVAVKRRVCTCSSIIVSSP